MSDTKLLDQFMLARSVGTPIISITTFDQENTIQSIQRHAAASNKEWPIVQWDVVKGWRPRNEMAKEALEKIYNEGQVNQASTRNPISALDLAYHLPEKTILFIFNAQHRSHPAESYDFWQAVANLRELFKDDLRTLVLLSPEIQLPPEVSHDILQLDEKLPSPEELREIIIETVKSYPRQIPVFDWDLDQAVEALRGIAAFPAEQTVAMSLSDAGINIDSLWDRKRQMIANTPGLKVYTGKEKFGDLGGCDQIKKALSNILNGLDAPRVIVFIDEGEKVFAGATSEVGDNTGVSQDFLGTMLSYMEDNECDGTILVGPPGAAKSAIAKATGNEAGIPTITMDLGGMKASLLGQSEMRLRQALKVIDAVGNGRAFFIMTSNKVVNLPPELKRRFTSGTYFFDLPTQSERELIWSIYLDKYGHGAMEDIDDKGWTGAEIRNCCRMAYRQRISLKEAASFIVPVSKSGAQQLAELRTQAQGNFLSANYPGTYDVEKREQDRPIKKRARAKVVGGGKRQYER